MVLTAIKKRRLFCTLLYLGLFLLFLNFLGPLFWSQKSQNQLKVNQWFQVENMQTNARYKFFGGQPDKIEWTCPARSAKSDVQMLNLYDQLPFDNPDGGVWAQGFPVEYDKEKVKKEKRLDVIVVPHTHCDPGWGWTFEEYYDMRTKHILNGMIKHLPIKQDMKFTYAEMSFFELWWSKIGDEEKRLTKSFLDSGQLEILTGGWVMTDEANARSFSILMELIEGHEFLLNQLDYRPKSHWSIDPFGLSATMAQLIKSANLTQMTIQRVHYSVKKHLAKTKQLEFRWRQLYAQGDETDIRTHMMPFQGYTAALTCGPDPQVCCQFDFQKLHGYCEWGGPNPTRITPQNVAERAALLADQYRKKAQLYKENVILVPLGDDFRYMTESEWEDQYGSYKQLFEEMNKREELNINARFGTLSDYFSILDQHLLEHDPTNEAERDLPILSGDFFTYADRDDHYWSGYYTSRPFYKHMDRDVQHWVRTADILHSIALWKANADGDKKEVFPGGFYDMLVEARRSLSLFQHHDGITGTSRDYVVLDYGRKMLSAIENCVKITAHATQYLLGISHENELKLNKEYQLEELPKQLKVKTGSALLLHNSLAFDRHEVVCLIVSSANSKVRKNGQIIQEQQIQPKIKIKEGKFVVGKNEHELCFEATIPALGFSKFEIVEEKDNGKWKAKIEVSQGVDQSLIPGSSSISSNSISLSNDLLSAKFDTKTGYLTSMQYTNEQELDVQLEFLHYGARKNSKVKINSVDSMSGPYLFLPDGPASRLSTTNNSFVLIRGNVRQSLLLKGPDEAQLFHQIHLDVSSNALDIVNWVDVRGTSNFELSMRVKSKEFNATDEQFYTDLNGFQVIRRKRFEKLPIQAHFYPMTTAAFVDANGKRLTLLGRQSLGAASLKAGWIESILDRRLAQDDNRGIGQGVSDNKHTESHFRLLIESLSSTQSTNEDNRAGFLSPAAVQLSHSLNYPMVTLHGHIATTTNKVPDSWTPLKQPFPCSIHLFALRTSSQPTEYPGEGKRTTKSKPEALMVLERTGVECLASGSKVEGCKGSGDGKFSLTDYFSFTTKSVKSTSLTGMYEQAGTISELQLQPMDLKAIKVEF